MTTDATFTSLPLLSKTALHAVRRWQNLPDALNDDDALSQGIITPEMLQLIMQIIQELMQNCLSNSTSAAFNRVQAYMNNTTRPLDRLGDQVRLNWIIDRWMVRLGVPRDTGDVVTIRNAIESVASGVQMDTFKALQTEVLWLTI